MTSLQSRVAKIMRLKNIANETNKGADRAAYFDYLKQVREKCQVEGLLEQNVSMSNEMARVVHDLQVSDKLAHDRLLKIRKLTNSY